MLALIKCKINQSTAISIQSIWRRKTQLRLIRISIIGKNRWPSTHSRSMVVSTSNLMNSLPKLTRRSSKICSLLKVKLIRLVHRIHSIKGQILWESHHFQKEEIVAKYLVQHQQPGDKWSRSANSSTSRVANSLKGTPYLLKLKILSSKSHQQTWTPLPWVLPECMERIPKPRALHSTTQPWLKRGSKNRISRKHSKSSWWRYSIHRIMRILMVLARRRVLWKLKMQ